MRGSRWVLITLFMVLSGCASWNLQEPDVSVVNLRLGPAEGLSQTLNVDLVIFNPNAVPLELSSLRYQLAVENYHLVTGGSTEPLNIPAGGEAHYTVPARLHILAGIGLLRALLSKPRDALNYRLEAELKPAKGWRSWRIDRSDRLSLSP